MIHETSGNCSRALKPFPFRHSGNSICSLNDPCINRLFQFPLQSGCLQIKLFMIKVNLFFWQTLVLKHNILRKNGLLFYFNVVYHFHILHPEWMLLIYPLSIHCIVMSNEKAVVNNISNIKRQNKNFYFDWIIFYHKSWYDILLKNYFILKQYTNIYIAVIIITKVYFIWSKAYHNNTIYKYFL